MQTKGGRGEEEERLLDEHGFERVLTERGLERWSRWEQGSLRRYTRYQAVLRARKEGS
jgi:hypothetical protein